MMRPTSARAGVSFLLGGLAAAGSLAASHVGTDAAHQTTAAHPVRLSAAQLPLAFERNVGQAPESVRYLARSRGATLLVDPRGATLQLTAQLPQPRKRLAATASRSLRRTVPPEVTRTASVRMQLEGARPGAVLSAAEPLPGRVNYILGRDPASWKTNIPTFSRVTSRGVYPGVDVTYYGNGKQLEYDFVVQPGADPGAIRLRLTGAERLSVDARGDLLIRTPAGVLRQERPVAYQEIDGRREPVSAAYELDGQSLAFQLGQFDAQHPLVIDPLMNFSTYLGGAGDDLGTGAGVDGSGNVYVVGTTSSANFPTVSPAQGGREGTQDAFVTKLNDTGSAVVYSTYLGGAAEESGQGISVSSSGVATVTGDTASADFPLLSEAQSNLGGITDAFVTRLDANGVPLYSTYLGGSDADVGNGIAVDLSGNAYVSGVTSSPSMPGTAPNALSGPSDAFVTKLSASGSTVSYTRYIGGGDFDVASAIDVSVGGEAVVVGFTFSTNFPRVGAVQNGLRGTNDAFVSRISADGTALQYSTYLGGTGDFDEARGVALDDDGNAYVVGTTYSGDFPVSSGFQSTAPGSGDAFVTKLNAAGNALLYSTYVGGSLDEAGNAVRVDGQNRAWIAGESSSPDFPTLGAVQSALGGGLTDGFVTCLGAAGNSLSFSTYLGGAGDDAVNGLAVDAGDNVYVAGATASSNFPTVQAYQATRAGGTDAFVVRLGSGPGAPLAPSNLHSSATQDQVTLTWTDNSSNEDYFEVERRTGGLGFSLLGTTTGTTLVDNDVTPNATYVYRVRAVNTIGASGFSNEHTVIVPTTLPADPSNLVAAVVTSSRIDLTWTDNSDNEVLFEIARKSGDGAFEPIGSVLADVTSYSDTTSLTPGIAYTYQVTAYNAMGSSNPAVSLPVTIPSGSKITVSPTKINFGNLKLGKFKSKTLTIKNAGKVALQGVIVAPADPFQIVSGGGTFNLLPKKSVKVTVRFFPEEADSYADVLQVLSTDTKRPTITVKLSGKAK